MKARAGTAAGGTPVVTLDLDLQDMVQLARDRPVRIHIDDVFEKVADLDAVVRKGMTVLVTTTRDPRCVCPMNCVAHPTERTGMTTPSVTCPRCQMTSHHPDDIRHGYCGNCHEFTGRHSGPSTATGEGTPGGVVPIRLVPVQVFGASCAAHCDDSPDCVETYGLMDAVQGLSDCNRAEGHIYRVDDTAAPEHRRPGDTVEIWVRRTDLPWFEKRFGTN